MSLLHGTGPNGAGKSTLLKIMAGVDKEFTGEAWSAEKATVGYLPQEPQLDETKTVQENVAVLRLRNCYCKNLTCFFLMNQQTTWTRKVMHGCNAIFRNIMVRLL